MTPQQRLSVWLLIGVGLIDALALNSVLIFIPFYVEKLGGPYWSVGAIIGIYPLTQFLLAPIWGAYGDKLGRKKLLLFSMLFTIMGFLLFAEAERFAHILYPAQAATFTLVLLFLSRLLDGFGGGNISIVVAYLTDTVPETEKTLWIGRLSSTFGASLILGPAIGGALITKLGYEYTALLAALLVTINWILILLWVPETIPHNESVVPHNPFTIIREVAQRPHQAIILGLSFVLWISFGLYINSINLYMADTLKLDEQSAGYIFGLVGFTIMLTQIFIVNSIDSYFGTNKALLLSFTAMGLCFIAYAFVTDLKSLLPVAITFGITGSCTITLNRSSMSQGVPADEVGKAMGSQQALEAFTKGIVPISATTMLGYGGLPLLGAVASTIIFLAVYIARPKLLGSVDK